MDSVSSEKNNDHIEKHLKPDTSDGEKVSQPKKKRLRWPWILLALIILLFVSIVGYTGVFNVPVLNSIFGTDTPIDLGIEPTEADLTSVMEKTPWTLNADSREFTIFNHKEFEGSVAIDHQLSSEEVTAFLQEYLQSDPYVSDIQVKLVEGGVEASAMLDKVIKAPVYVKVGITRASSKSVTLDIENIKVGNYPVPQQYIDQIEDYVSDLVNNRMSEIDGFSMETLEYHDGYDIFKGTFPETVTPGGGKDWWSGV